jgi:4-amino-4-deoxychorismate lyase
MSSEGPLRDGNTADFSLIETVRWEAATGFIRLERHLARLRASADTLGFAYDRQAAVAALNHAVEDADGSPALRMRLTLSHNGIAAATAQPFAPLPPDWTWTLRIANTRLDSRDDLLRHKTTRRGVYEAARAEFPPSAADEVILANERGEICEGTITSIFVEDGGPMLLTPTLGCGLLAGVLRAELLELGKAKEAILSREDLLRAKVIHVGNSLRGLIPAKLAMD